MEKQKILKKIKNEILVSCQAAEPDLFADLGGMVKMAENAVMAGAKGIRANHPDYIRAMREKLGEDIVIIGIWKETHEGSDVSITLSMNAVDALVMAGADIIALDCTDRFNVYGYKGYELLMQIREKYPEIPTMADCADIEEAKLAKEAGADIVSCTLSGYTQNTLHKNNGSPDYRMIEDMAKLEDVFVISEGKVWSREDAIKCFEKGADAVVVGSSLTSPFKIAKRFLDAGSDYFKEGIRE